MLRCFLLHFTLFLLFSLLLKLGQVLGGLSIIWGLWRQRPLSHIYLVDVLLTERGYGFLDHLHFVTNLWDLIKHLFIQVFCCSVRHHRIFALERRPSCANFGGIKISISSSESLNLLLGWRPCPTGATSSEESSGRLGSLRAKFILSVLVLNLLLDSGLHF